MRSPALPTGFLLSFLIHGLFIAGALALGFRGGAPRQPEVFLVSFTPVLYHSEELARGSPLPAPPVPNQSFTTPAPRKEVMLREPPRERMSEERPRVAKASPRAEAATATVSMAAPGQGGTAEPGAGNYEVLVVSHLMNARQYPERARRRGIEGDVILDIEIARDGGVIDSKLSTASSSVILNEEALQMVHRAAPFPPVPHNYRPHEQLRFRIPVRFELKARG